MTYVVTAAGKRLALNAPDPALISLDDIAERLARINRYAGMPVVWSVAQHTLFVDELLIEIAPEARPYGLLHDAHEGFLGDWITPVKRALSRAAQADLASLEEGVASAIRDAAGVPAPSDLVADAVRRADLLAYQAEVAMLMPRELAREFEHLAEPTFDARMRFAHARFLHPTQELKTRFREAFPRHYAAESLTDALAPRAARQRFPEVPFS